MEEMMTGFVSFLTAKVVVFALELSFPILCPPPTPIIFERQILPQQTIYRWKGSLTASRIHFKYWKIFGFRDFMRNFHEITSQWLQNGCPKKSQT